MLVIDGYLDLAYNATFFNHNLKKSAVKVRAGEADNNSKGPAPNY